jgi:hypothetical protein
VLERSIASCILIRLALSFWASWNGGIGHRSACAVGCGAVHIQQKRGWTEALQKRSRYPSAAAGCARY